MENEEVLATLDQEVATFLSAEKSAEAMAKVKEMMDSDPEVKSQVEKAETEEDMYSVFKKFISMPIEAFKKLFHSVTEYFKADKVELSDETMDAVVGGWSFGQFWNAYKERIIGGVIVIAAAGLMFTGLGAAVGCLVTAASLSCTGTAVGAIVGAVVGIGGSTGVLVADAMTARG